jgi:formylglycine-generating enzyme required for sulfatase activity
MAVGWQAQQERERQRVVAEAKAAEEKALAEAKAAEEKALAEAHAKAEAEERELQRLAAEARSDEERAMAEAKLGRIRLVGGGRFEPGEGLFLGVLVRWIPAGRYLMGSSAGDVSQGDAEVQHEVVLTRGFFLAVTECTQGQWEALMGGNPSHFKGPERPVEQVSWEEAVEYCRKLTAKQRAEGILPEGWEWRLPTEVEWEYAARAGTTGVRYGELDAIGWWNGNSEKQTQPVKRKTANVWGLHDMLGNVSEWSSEWYGVYPTGSLTDPSGPPSGSLRVVRGGSWGDDARYVRSAYRLRLVSGARNRSVGFRPALSSVR